MKKQKITIEDLAQSIKTLANKMVTRDDFVNFATKDDLKSFSIKDDLKNFATKDDFDRFATKNDLDRFATKDDLVKFATKDDLKNFAVKDDLKSFATKDDLKNFATKDDLKDNLANFATKDDLKEEIENLAIMTRQSFEEVDFKFAVVNDRFCDMGKRFDKLENKIEEVHQETVKNSDAFAQLKKYVDSETAAMRYHLLRVDEKIGLAGA